MEVPATIDAPMTDIVNQDVCYGVLGLSTLANKAPDGIPNSNKLGACRRGIVEEA